MGFGGGGGGAAPRRTITFPFRTGILSASRVGTGPETEPTQFGQAGSLGEMTPGINVTAIKGAGTILSARLIGEATIHTDAGANASVKMALRLQGQTTPLFTNIVTVSGATAVTAKFERVLTASEITTLLTDGNCFYAHMLWVTSTGASTIRCGGTATVGENAVAAALVIEVENP